MLYNGNKWVVITIERYVVSKETGEILDTLQKGDRIVKSKSIDSYESVIELKYDNFVIMNTDMIKMLSDKLDNSELVFMIKLIPYISYKSNRIVYSNGRKISTEDFMKITGYSRNKVYQIVSSLIIKNVLYKERGDNGAIEYYLNPNILHRGNKTEADIVNRFNSKDAKIRELDNKEGDLVGRKTGTTSENT